MTTTSSNLPLNFLKLLAHDLRWQLIAALAESDWRVQELVDAVQRPQNLVSYHLRLLREGQVVKERRSNADARDVYYTLDLEYLRSHYLDSGQSLHPALTSAVLPEGDRPQNYAAAEENPAETQQPIRVLFLCTHNSARSQLAEGILRAIGGQQVETYSAGTEPSQVHPLAIRAAAAMNIDLSSHRSKHIGDFAGQSFDYVITVCDKVREVCPVFPDTPRQIHWSFPDPAVSEGNEQQQYQRFVQTARELSTRIRYLLLTTPKKPAF